MKAKSPVKRTSTPRRSNIAKRSVSARSNVPKRRASARSNVAVKTKPLTKPLQNAADRVSTPQNLPTFKPAEGLMLGPRVALAGAHFWIKRTHALVNQMRALAGCASSADLIDTQTKFIAQMRDEFAVGTEEISGLFASAFETRATSRHLPLH